MRMAMFVSIFFAFIFLVSCSDDNGISSSQIPDLRTAMISISGQNVTDTSIQPGMGGSTLYIAYPSRVEPGLAVWMQFRGPSMMNGGSGKWMMYDDGTHGDPKPGDGEYCFEDTNGMPGVHMMNAMSGHYSFEFYCVNSTGDHGIHSNAWIDVR